MEFDHAIYLLSSDFITDYPPAKYPEMMQKEGCPYTCLLIHLTKVVKEVTEYINTYIHHQDGTSPLHPREFLRRYQYSTLQYYHDIMGLQ